MRIIVFILFLLVSKVCFATDLGDLSQLDDYFAHLKEFKYEMANEELVKVDDERLNSELELLTDLLYNGITGDTILLKPVAADNSEDSFFRTINLLNQGYYQIFFKSDKSKAYQFFYEAIKIADEIGYTPLKKRSLLAMLKYFHNEIARNNLDYTVYLERYKDLRSDGIDDLWLTIYQLIFSSADVKGLQANYF